MNHRLKQLLLSTECRESQLNADSPSPAPLPLHQLTPEDDRYPGTFFRVPRIPVAGKTAWGVAQ